MIKLFRLIAVLAMAAVWGVLCGFVIPEGFGRFAMQTIGAFLIGYLGNQFCIRFGQRTKDAIHFMVVLPKSEVKYLLAIIALLFASTASAQDRIVVEVMSLEACHVCREMQPIIEDFQSRGYPIQQIDVLGGMQHIKFAGSHSQDARGAEWDAFFVPNAKERGRVPYFVIVDAKTRRPIRMQRDGMERAEFITFLAANGIAPPAPNQKK